MAIDFDKPLTWIVLGIIFIVVVVLFAIFAIAKIKAFSAVFGTVAGGILDVAKSKAKVKEIEAQNEHIKLRGHAVKCEYCGVTHTYKKSSEIPVNCPNCGGALTYEYTDTEKETREEYRKSRTMIYILLFAFSPIIFGLIVSILDWLF